MRLTLHRPVILWIGFVKDSKDLTDKLQSIKLQDNEELVNLHHS